MQENGKLPCQIFKSSSVSNSSVNNMLKCNVDIYAPTSLLPLEEDSSWDDRNVETSTTGKFAQDWKVKFKVEENNNYN